MSGSVAPSGHFAECVSGEGVFDLTGNLWEWSNSVMRARLNPLLSLGRLENDHERHRDTDQSAHHSRIPALRAEFR